jgi:hypothetical protein
MKGPSTFEIKIIAGSNFGLIIGSSEEKSIPSHLQFSVPDNSNVYTLRVKDKGSRGQIFAGCCPNPIFVTNPVLNEIDEFLVQVVFFITKYS